MFVWIIKAMERIGLVEFANERNDEMWFTMYLHIKVRWIGTATPSNQQHPARHMARFDDQFETVEEFRCHSQSDAALIVRQTESIYCGPNCITTIQSVDEGKYREIEASICNACEELDKLEELFV